MTRWPARTSSPTACRARMTVARSCTPSASPSAPGSSSPHRALRLGQDDAAAAHRRNWTAHQRPNPRQWHQRGRAAPAGDLPSQTVGFRVFSCTNLLPALTAQQNVELPLAAAHVAPPRGQARARSLLAEWAWVTAPRTYRASYRAASVSACDRPRAGQRPPLVLADEPTGSLDTAASRHVWRLLSDLRSRRGTTVIVASHDITLAEHADRTLHLVDGRLAEDQDPRFEPAPGQVAWTALTQTLISLRHRPGRALLTALGSALGIGTIVAPVGGVRRCDPDGRTVCPSRPLRPGAVSEGRRRSDHIGPTGESDQHTAPPVMGRRRHGAAAARAGHPALPRCDRLRRPTHQL